MATPEPSSGYLSEFFQSPGNVTLLLGGLAAAVAMSFPYGLSGAAFPLLATIAIETLACLFVPDMPSFRAWANRRRAAMQNSHTAERLFAEIQSRCRDIQTVQGIKEEFDFLEKQVNTLVAHVGAQPGVLQATDMQRIRGVPAQFLSLKLSLLVIEDRAASVDLRKIQRKLEELSAQIAKPEPGADVRQLSRARDEYQGLLARHQRMLSRRTALEAAVLTLPDQLAEVYQLIMSDALQTDTARLTDAISNLQLRQEIEAEIADELSFSIESQPPRAAQPVGVRQR